MKVLQILSFPLFLCSFAISFFMPGIYKEIIFFEFIVLAPLVVMTNYKPSSLSQTYQVIFILFTALTLLFGVPGSALGYFISASIGLFVVQNDLSYFKKHKELDFRLFILTTVFFLSASFYLLYLNYKNPFSFELVSSYFGIASINYASLTVGSFCSIFSVWCIRRQIVGTYFSLRQEIVLRIFSGILVVIIFGLIILSETRSLIFSFLPPFLYAVQPKKLSHFIGIILTSIIVLFLLFPDLTEFIVSFMVPGRESIIELYATEIEAAVRFESAFTIFEKAIPSMSMCTDCSEHLSYSGISNLIALSFPFSLFFVFVILSFFAKYLAHFLSLIRANMLFSLIIIFSFGSSVIQVVFQADFLSMVSLFYVVGSGLLFAKNISSRRKRPLIKTIIRMVIKFRKIRQNNADCKDKIHNYVWSRFGAAGGSTIKQLPQPSLLR